MPTHLSVSALRAAKSPLSPSTGAPAASATFPTSSPTGRSVVPAAATGSGCSPEPRSAPAGCATGPSAVSLAAPVAVPAEHNFMELPASGTGVTRRPVGRRDRGDGDSDDRVSCPCPGLPSLRGVGRGVTGHVRGVRRRTRAGHLSVGSPATRPSGLPLRKLWSHHAGAGESRQVATGTGAATAAEVVVARGSSGHGPDDLPEPRTRVNHHDGFLTSSLAVAVRASRR